MPKLRTQPQSYSEQVNRLLEKRLARYSEQNRATMQAFVAAKRSEGIKPKSISGYVQALGHLDEQSAGRSFRDLTAADLAGFLDWMRRTGLSESTVFGYAFKVRAFLKHSLDVDKLPRSFQQALRVRQPLEQFVGRLVSDDEFHGLLKATVGRGAVLGTTTTQELSQAILWTLWDSGFRARELLSLNVGDVRFDDRDGCTLNLRPEAEGLKTGARSIYASLCARALRVWLDVHPRGADPKAPLFPPFRDRSGAERLTYSSLLQHLLALGQRSGVNAGSSRAKTISPHDFRHTAATRDARNGWNEAQLRQKYGWSPGSKMPALYVHLSLGDQRERVRRDAGVDDMSYRVAMETGDDGVALAQLLARLLDKGKRQPAGAGRAPVVPVLAALGSEVAA